MKTWVTGIRRAVMMGLAWAACWVPVGVLVGRLIVGEAEPEHIGGALYSGFICGALFSALAGITAGRRRLDELSLGRAGALGVVSGLLVGALPFVLTGDYGAPNSLFVAGDGLLYVALFGALPLLSAVSGVASAWLARMAKNGASARAA